MLEIESAKTLRVNIGHLGVGLHLLWENIKGGSFFLRSLVLFSGASEEEEEGVTGLRFAICSTRVRFFNSSHQKLELNSFLESWVTFPDSVITKQVSKTGLEFLNQLNSLEPLDSHCKP